MDLVSLYDTQIPIFRRVIEWLPEAVAVEDLHHRVLLVNDAFCKITGYSEAEWKAIGSIDILVPKQYRDSFNQRMIQHRSEEIFDFEMRALRKDQSHFTSLLKISPLKDEHCYG